MKTKEENWSKGSYDIELTFENNLKHIENGRVYKCLGVEISGKYKSLSHIPTKTRIGVYTKTLKEMKELADKLLEVDVDWNISDKLYFANLDKEIAKKLQIISKGEL